MGGGAGSVEGGEWAGGEAVMVGGWMDALGATVGAVMLPG